MSPALAWLLLCGCCLVSWVKADEAPVLPTSQPATPTTSVLIGDALPPLAHLAHMPGAIAAPDQPLASLPLAQPLFRNCSSQALPNCAEQLAEDLLKVLKARRLNLISAESLTAGMLASLLVDISPGYGGIVYGGFIVYDSDAKRKFIDVSKPDVYTWECAVQMAEGALTASRALVSVGVTGEAGPVHTSRLDTLGVVDLAVSLRTPLGPTTLTSRITACSPGQNGGTDRTVHLCRKFKSQVQSSGRADVSLIRKMRQRIRLETVAYAYVLVLHHVLHHCPDDICLADVRFTRQPYDGDYLPCGEPSNIINNHLAQPFPSPFPSCCCT